MDQATSGLERGHLPKCDHEDVQRCAKGDARSNDEMVIDIGNNVASSKVSWLFPVNMIVVVEFKMYKEGGDYRATVPRF